jgi:hypothetical protein
LLIKRKTNGSAARKAALAQRTAGSISMHGQMGVGMQGVGMPLPAEFFTQAVLGNPACQPSLGIFPAGMIFADAQQQVAFHQVALHHQALQNAQQKNGAGLSHFGFDRLPSASPDAAIQDANGSSKSPNINGSSLEHLQQLNAMRNSVLNLAGFGWSPATLASMGSMSSLFAPTTSAPKPAPNMMPPPEHSSMPATIAMNAAAKASSQGNNPFESNSALNELVGNTNSNFESKANKGSQSLDSATSISGPKSGNSPNSYQHGTPTQLESALQQRLSSSNLLRTLPSAGTMFPDTLSSVSLSGLLPGMSGMSSNRLNSMLSLGSFLSRDPSMADLLPGNSHLNVAGFSGAASYNHAGSMGSNLNTGYNKSGLGNTTLVPLTGNSSQFDFAGASAALQSLANAAGPASALFGPYSQSPLSQSQESSERKETSNPSEEEKASLEASSRAP